jgi:hypothetical protein
MSNSQNKFIEGIVFDLNNTIVMLGDFVNEAPAKQVLISHVDISIIHWKFFFMFHFIG